MQRAVFASRCVPLCRYQQDVPLPDVGLTALESLEMAFAPFTVTPGGTKQAHIERLRSTLGYVSEGARQSRADRSERKALLWRLQQGGR